MLDHADSTPTVLTRYWVQTELYEGSALHLLAASALTKQGHANSPAGL